MDASNPSTSAYKNFSYMRSPDNDDEFQKSESIDILKSKCRKFTSGQFFSSAVTKAFAETGAEVSHWACCLEYHKNKGIHYHMAINMTKLGRWKSVKEQLKLKHNINVHFSDKSLGYIAVYRYIC